MEVKNIKEENNKKIEKYEFLLENTETEIKKSKMKNHELYISFKENNKKIKLLRKFINSVGISAIALMAIPVSLYSIVSGLTIGSIYSIFLIIANKDLTKINNRINQIDNCTKNDQALASDEIEEINKYKNILENSLFVRNVLNAVIDKQYIAQFEIEKIKQVFNDNDILHDFNIDEYNILNEYIKENDIQQEVINNSLNFKYSNTKQKVYQKIK